VEGGGRGSGGEQPGGMGGGKLKEKDEGRENEGVKGEEEEVGEGEGKWAESKKRLMQVISSHFFCFSFFSSFFSTSNYELILVSVNNLFGSCQRMFN
jgi:hypothetical protein